MPRLRIMTWNLLQGGSGAEGRRLDLITTVLRAARPDVFVACEAHGFVEEPQLLADFSAAVGMKGRVAPAPSGAHVAVFVRGSAGLAHFEAADIGGPQQAALAVVRAPGFADLLLAGVHLDYRDPGSRLAQVRALLGRMPPEWPRAVVGDLNQLSHEDALSRRDLLTLPLHHVERHVGADGEPDTRPLQALAAAGFVDAWRLAHAGEPAASGFTVPTSIPDPPRFGGKRIDYILLSAGVPAALTACEVWREAPASRASDHLPLFADLEPHAP